MFMKSSKLAGPIVLGSRRYLIEPPSGHLSGSSLKDAQAQDVDHLHKLILHKDFRKPSDGVWGVLFPDCSDVYEDRMVRMIASPQYAPISDVLSPSNFVDVLRQLVGCESFL